MGKEEVTACGPFDIEADVTKADLVTAVTRPSESDRYGSALGAVVTQQDLVHLVQIYGDRLTELTIDGEKTLVSLDPSAQNPIGMLPVLKTLTVQHTLMRQMVFKSINMPALEHLDLNGCAAGVWDRLDIDLPSLKSLSMERVMLTHGGPLGFGNDTPTSNLGGTFGNCVSRCSNLRSICCDKFCAPGLNHMYLPKCTDINLSRCNVEHIDILHAPKLSFIDLSYTDDVRAAHVRDFRQATAQDAIALNALNQQHSTKAARTKAVNAVMAELRARDKADGIKPKDALAKLPALNVDGTDAGATWEAKSGPRAMLLRNKRVKIAAEGDDSDDCVARLMRMLPLRHGNTDASGSEDENADGNAAQAAPAAKRQRVTGGTAAAGDAA